MPSSGCGRILMTLLTTVALGVPLAACGSASDGGSDSGGATATSTSKTEQTSTSEAEQTSTSEAEQTSTSEAEQTVTSCLSAGKLDKVEDRGGGVWVGFTKDGDLIRVKRLDSSADAKKAVQDATDVAGASGGRYVVFGPQGSKLTVTPIAACLRRVKS